MTLAHHMQQTAVDKQWFLDKLGERKQSVRGLARHLEIDASAVSRMFSSQRKMQMEEASNIALFLGVPVQEVLKHAGVALDDQGLPTRVLLVATVNGDGWMTMLREPKPLPQDVIERAQSAIPRDKNTKIIAAQVRAKEGQWASLDDAVMLFRHTDKFDPASVGTLSVARGSQGIGICRIISARKTGEAVVLRKSGKHEEFDLHWATPILAIIP